MSLARALVDRARRVYNREDPDQPWREGSPKAEVAYGPWVRVRFRRQNEAEQSSGIQVNEDGALLVGLVYEDGAPLHAAGRFQAWDADDMVQIESEGGTEVWQVSSGVRPMRRRKGYVGFRCSIRHVRETVVAEEALDDPDVPDPVLIGPGTGERQPVESVAGLPEPSDPWDWEAG